MLSNNKIQISLIRIINWHSQIKVTISRNTKYQITIKYNFHKQWCNHNICHKIIHNIRNISHMYLNILIQYKEINKDIQILNNNNMHSINNFHRLLNNIYSLLNNIHSFLNNIHSLLNNKFCKLNINMNSKDNNPTINLCTSDGPNLEFRTRTEHFLKKNPEPNIFLKKNSRTQKNFSRTEHLKKKNPEPNIF